jgi:anti-sigma regulatory factor (Ser/Thr protein kinase)
LKLTDFLFERVIKDCFSVVGSLKGNKKVRLINSSSQNVTLHTDYHRLKRVILNLLTNALKYTAEGQISLGCFLDHEDTNIIEIRVQDTGYGMDEEAQRKLFKLFNTNVETNKGATKSVVNRDGIGLGLSTSLELVQKLGPNREISVKSIIDQGSTFSFKIYKDYRLVGEIQKQRVKEVNFTQKLSTKSQTKSVLQTIIGMSNIQADHKSVSVKTPQRQSTVPHSRLDPSTPAHESTHRRKLNVLIIESTSLLVHQLRPLLQKAMTPYRDDFSLVFFYIDKLAGCLEEVAALQAKHKLRIDLVVAALESNTPIDRQKALATDACSLSKLWSDCRQTSSIFLLVNNTGEALQPFLGLSGGSKTSAQYVYICEGYPSQRDLNKFLANWINKLG